MRRVGIAQVDQKHPRRTNSAKPKQKKENFPQPICTHLQQTTGNVRFHNSLIFFPFSKRVVFLRQLKQKRHRNTQHHRFHLSSFTKIRNPLKEFKYILSREEVKCISTFINSPAFKTPTSVQAHYLSTQRMTALYLRTKMIFQTPLDDSTFCIEWQFIFSFSIWSQTKPNADASGNGAKTTLMSSLPVQYSRQVDTDTEVNCFIVTNHTEIALHLFFFENRNCKSAFFQQQSLQAYCWNKNETRQFSCKPFLMLITWIELLVQKLLPEFKKLKLETRRPKSSRNWVALSTMYLCIHICWVAGFNVCGAKVAGGLNMISKL